MEKLDMNSALVIVDVQKGWDDDFWGKRNNPEAEKNIARLLDAWRSSRRPVVFFQHMSRNPKSPLFPGQAGNEIKEIVRPIDDEKVFTKSVNSCFIGTGFEDWLRENGIDTLVIVGITTQHCVSTTARMSGNLGFRTFVVSDATVAFEAKGVNGVKYDAETVHALSLATIMDEFATVLNTEAMLKKS
ncbi:MAG: cysteine hydrolase [Thermoplasmatales archaeon B_DKE]|nr:MAG: cysteine hydrolase [Thermoplasmatales archaeon B_DKE]